MGRYGKGVLYPSIIRKNVNATIDSVDAAYLDTSGSLHLARYRDDKVFRSNSTAKAIQEELDDNFSSFRRIHTRLIAQGKVRITDDCADEMWVIADDLEKHGDRHKYRKIDPRYSPGISHNREVGSYLKAFLEDAYVSGFMIPHEDRKVVEEIRERAIGDLSIEDASTIYAVVRDSQTQRVALFTEDWDLIKEIARLTAHVSGITPSVPVTYSPKILRSHDIYKGPTIQSMTNADTELRRMIRESQGVFDYSSISTTQA